MARQIRRSEAERYLQQGLHKQGFKFRCNVIIDGHEVDFLVEPYVAIEVDGVIHVRQDVMAKDRRKTRHLVSRQYIVLRFTNDEVRYDLRRCIRDIEAAIKSQRTAFGRWGKPVSEMSAFQQQLATHFDGNGANEMKKGAL